MPKCECGCDRELSGKQKRFFSDACRERWWTEARKRGAADQISMRMPAGKHSFHFASLENSIVLQKTLELLRRTQPTPKQIQDFTGTTRPSSDISELRHNGFDIAAIYIGRSDNGRKIYRYVLTEVAK